MTLTSYWTHVNLNRVDRMIRMIRFQTNKISMPMSLVVNGFSNGKKLFSLYFFQYGIRPVLKI